MSTNRHRPAACGDLPRVFGKSADRRGSCELHLALDAIRQQRLFGDLTDGEIERFAGLFSQSLVPAGHVVFRQGEASTALYLVGQGAVALYHRQQGCRTRCLALLGRGELFGELGLLTGLRRPVTAQTSRASRILEVAGEEALAMLQEHPLLRWRLRMLATRRYSLKALLTA